MKCIKNGRIVLPDRTVSGAALLFEDKILGICNTEDIPSDATVIDAENNYVCPGFIDIHIHGYMGDDVSDGDPEGIRRMAKNIVKNGVTSWLPTTMTVSMKEINAAFDAVRSLREESKTWDGAEILGINCEGPFINPSKKGAQAEENILPPDKEFAFKNSDIIKIITVAPEMDNNFEFIEAVRGKMIISMGHTDANYITATKSIDCGVSHVTHLFNAMSPLSHRNPGVVGAALLSDVTVEMICDTFHVHPDLFDLVITQKPDRLCAVTDCTRAGGMSDGEYTLGGQKIFLHGIECRLGDGTIAGSVLKFNRALKNIRRNSSLPMHKVVNCGTLIPAALIGEGNRKGSLEPGRDADIVIVNGNFNIFSTYIKGDLKYEDKCRGNSGPRLSAACSGF